MAARSSGEPYTFGPVNHFFTEATHHRPTPTNDSRIIGPVKLAEFTSSLFHQRHCGNSGETNRIEMKATQTTEIQPTISLYPFRFQGPGRSRGCAAAGGSG